VAVESDGSTTSTVATCGTQPCTSFDLISTSTKGTYVFKIVSTWTGGLVTSTSADITVILCSSSETVSATTATATQSID
tara:strand:- start:1236 stop:1472 length:237 start_codon:yes stop_codon:yes gene_type:complete